MKVIDRLAEDYFQISCYRPAAALLERLLVALEAAEPRDLVESAGRGAAREGPWHGGFRAEALCRDALALYAEADNRARALVGVAAASAASRFDCRDFGEAESRRRATLPEVLPYETNAETAQLKADLARRKGQS